MGLFFVFQPKRSLEQRLFDSAQSSLENKDYKSAIENFERVTTYVPDSPVALESARLGGKLSLYQTQDFKKAIGFFKQIVRHGKDQKEVVSAQKQIAEIYYEKLSDYPQAVLEYNRLLETEPSDKEDAEIRGRVARAYFYSGNFEQTILEVEDFEKKHPDSPLNFELWILKATSLSGLKRNQEAIQLYDKILKKFSDRSDLDEIYINKALAYEELKDWDMAIASLESGKGKVAHEDIIEMKIKNLTLRKAKKKSQ